MSRPPVLHRLAGFSGLQLVSAVAPLALLPVIARAGGEAGWAAVTAGQSLGTLVAAVCVYGWVVAGPAAVAGAGDADRWRAYRASLSSRGALLLVAAPLGLLVSLAVAPDGFVRLTALMVLMQAVGGLAPPWYAIGVGSPTLLLRYDAGPRIVAMLAAAGALALGAPLEVYPLSVLVASSLGIVALTRHLRRTVGAGVPRGEYGPGAAWRDVGLVLRRDASAAGSQIAGAAFGATTVATVALVATTSATAEFGSADKLYRFALMAVVAVGNSFQGWVAEVPFPAAARRMRASFLGLGALGLVGGAGLALLGPLATRILLGDEVAASHGSTVPFGVAFLAACVSTSLGRHILVPLGRVRDLFVGTVVGAVVGISGTALGGWLAGAAGGATGYALGETAFTLTLAFLLLRAVRTGRTSPSGVGDPEPPDRASGTGTHDPHDLPTDRPAPTPPEPAE